MSDTDQWLVRIEGALPAYISIEQYQRNLARLEANRATATTLGAPRDGNALLTGLVACGRCGRRMQTTYEANQHGGIHRYACNHRHVTYGEPVCQQMAGGFLDEFVVAQALSALAPAALEVSVAAAKQIEAHREQVDRIWRQRLERAAIACDRARRCYQLAEPENRLVVRQLERDGEQVLAAQDRLTEQYEHHQATRRESRGAQPLPDSYPTRCPGHARHNPP